MKVILAENMASLGRIGDVVKVAPGYARNYLVPKGLALEATDKNVRDLEHKKRILARKREKVRQQMLSQAEKLKQVRVTLMRKVAEEDRLYGSVSAVDIAKVLEDQGFTIDRKDIKLVQPIKQLGEYQVSIRVDADVEAEIKVVVDKEE
ncbi:MAG TPA: 50S ribosomal protein L9 [Syntrophobacteraceae bacterium]|jgi:large subunit ribosomal protein L9|nr:50S ribosomal protein L9 [Syntrophobacteraceae bacterium]HBZ54123.1 50S ribosomal protein L9 [Syntrophobacteraceae bacterium]